MDTMNKRASALGFSKPFVTHVIPKGSVDQAQKQTILSFYNGILASAPSFSDGDLIHKVFVGIKIGL